MEQLNTTLISDEATIHIFGLRENVTTHQKWLKAATVFTQIRSQVEEDEKKIERYTVSTLSRSTKPKTFRNSVKEAVSGKETGRILMPFISDRHGDASLANSKIEPLDMFIFACFTLTSKNYTAIRENGLVDAFPRLFRYIIPIYKMNPRIKEKLIDIIREECNGNAESESILACLDAVQPTTESADIRNKSASGNEIH
ncbi:hypothetical protein HIM_11465 [Hirsutella minnesotensis 3608]|uniref:Uncharacterized protein n=1 Tax=Hirsutella minnesotensis 3608 TaxID=1043627 RepID=A0A0F7ZWK8_9HYPO|nr:hypothetical protein HIM_11465 [Hirsutella minnesotensis 3608]